MRTLDAYRVAVRVGRAWWHELRPHVDACTVELPNADERRQAREVLGAAVWREAVTSGERYEIVQHGRR